MKYSILKQLLFVSIFLYSFTSINFRGEENLVWISNAMGMLLIFSYFINLSSIKFKFNYALFVLLILVIWNTLSIFSNPEIFRYVITTMLIFILAFVMFNICSTYPIAIEYVKWSFIISLFIQIYISNTFVQYTDWGTVDRHRGTLGNPNLYAFFINIAFIFLLQKIGKPSNIIKYLIIFGVIGLVFFEIINAGSRKGILFISLILLFYYSSSFFKSTSINRIIFLIFGSFALFQLSIYLIESQYFYRFFEVFLYKENYIADLHRYALGQDALRLFFEKPIFGWGGDGFRYYNKVDFTYSHVNFLELLVNYGLIGFLLFYSMYIWFFRKLKDIENSNSYDTQVISDKNVFIFFLLVTLLLDVAMVRVFERLYWLLISMYLGRLYFDESNKRIENKS